MPGEGPFQPSNTAYSGFRLRREEETAKDFSLRKTVDFDAVASPVYPTRYMRYAKVRRRGGHRTRGWSVVSAALRLRNRPMTDDVSIAMSMALELDRMLLCEN